MKAKINIKLPNIKIDKNKDFYLFPYFIADAENLTFNNIIREKILTGTHSVLLKPVGLASTLKKDVSHILKQDYLIREYDESKLIYFVGKNENINFSTKIKTLKLYTKLSVETKLTLHFVDKVDQTNNFIWDFQKNIVKKDFIHFFFYAPELNQNDFLFVTSLTVFINPITGKYHSHRVTFGSLADYLNQAGIVINQRIQLGNPGENYLKPNVLMLENGTKQVTIEEITVPGIKYFQIEPEGLFSFVSIRIWGRKKLNSWKDFALPSRLIISQFLEPIPSPWSKSQNYEINYAILNLEPTVISWFNSWKKDDGLDILFPDEKRTNLGSCIVKKVGEFNILDQTKKNVSIDPDKTKFNKFLQDKTNTQNAVYQKPNDFVNYNAELNEAIDVLEFGSRIYKNKKDKYRYWVGKTWGITAMVLGGIIGGKVGAGVGAYISKFVSPMENLFSSNLFWNYENIDFKNSFNVLFPLDVFKIMENSFGIHGSGDNMIIPIDLFTEKNSLKNLIGTTSFNTTLFFELTDKWNTLGNKPIKTEGYSTLKIFQDEDYYLKDSSEALRVNYNFIIDKIEIKGIGGNNLRLTAFDEFRNPNWFLETQTRAKFADDVKELTTTYTFNDNLLANTDWTEYTNYLMDDNKNWVNPLKANPANNRFNKINKINYYETGRIAQLDTQITTLQPNIEINRLELGQNGFNYLNIKIDVVTHDYTNFWTGTETTKTVTKTEKYKWDFEGTGANSITRPYIIGWGWVGEYRQLHLGLTFRFDANGNMSILKLVEGTGEPLVKSLILYINLTRQ